FRPRPPFAKKVSTVSAKPSSGASRRSYCSSMSHCLAKAAWMAGERLCSIGLPMTAYRWGVFKVMGSGYASFELVAREMPGSGDGQDVGVGSQLCRQRGEWRGQLNDTQGRLVQHRMHGGPIDLDP